MKEGFYCSANCLQENGNCKLFELVKNDEEYLKCTADSLISCQFCRRKHETPDQFKERTGREYPDDRAVYWRIDMVDHYTDWKIWSYKEIKNDMRENIFAKVEIFCANTDFGPPEGDFEVKE